MASVFQNKSMINMFLRIALPVAFQNLLSFAVGLMDTIMVGALGEVELSAVSVANQPFFLYTMCIFGLSSGASVLISQYWGKNDREAISKVFGIAIKISVIAGVVAMAVVLSLPQQVMQLYTDEAAVVPYGVEYLRVVGFSYIFFAFTSSYINCIRNVERVKIAVITFSISFFVNVFFNYMFIYGKFGAPQMGVAGAAVGTLIARVTEFCIVLFYALRVETRVKLHLSNIIRNDKVLSKDFAHYALPVVINEMMWAFGTSAQMAVLGRMSVTALASVSVVTNVSQIMTVLIYGAASATLVITGKYIGAKEYDKARKSAPQLVGLNILIAVASAVALVLLRPAFISLYSLTDAMSVATKAAINSTLLVAAGIMVFQAINMSCIVGVFRGGGDTIFAMWLDVIGVWGIAVPLGAVGGLVFGTSIPLTFFLLRSDEVVKAVACLFRLKGGKWLKNVTRDKQGHLLT
ncbi:MATE family efflux transporter [Christensenellaceae bacterium OttesenSCG-928-K19]|nr:MATE family efflux transporter [Christensenellaceae bacterium OttesenSCG-928-K19]